MRIREFSLLRYGMLPPIPRLRLERNLVLFWGPNEQGKTMLLEALLKMLLGTGSTVRSAVKSAFPYLSRVEAFPQGTVVVELEGRIRRFPQKKPLHEMLSLAPEEFRNLFVVRDSDLSVIPLKKGPDFYTRITERTEQITGMQASQIRALKTTLLDLARLTPEGRFRNVQGEKLRDRLVRAFKLARRVEEILKQARREGLDALERKLTRLEVALDDLQEERALLERARVWSKIHQAEKHLAGLRDIHEKLKTLEHFSEEEASAWDRLRRDVIRLQDELKALREKRQEIQQRFADAEENRRVLLQDLEAVRLRLKEAEALRLLVREVRDLEERVASGAIWARTFRGFALVSALLLALSLGGWALQGDPLWGVFSGVFLVTGLVGGLGVLRHTRREAELARARQHLAAEASRRGFQASTPEDLDREIGALTRKEEVLNRSDAALEQTLRGLAERLEELHREIRQKEEDRRNLLQDEEALAARSGLDSPAAYREKLRGKQRLEGERQAHLGALEGLLGGLPPGADPLNYYARMLVRVREEAGPEPGIPYREEDLVALEEKQKTLEAEKAEVARRLRDLREVLREVGRAATEVLRPEQPLVCESLTQLEEIHRLLVRFLRDHEVLKERVERILAILETIEREEQEKVKGLFGPDSEVSRRFARITGERYTEVVYDEEEGDLRVRTAAGEELCPDQLSGGAFDQLYFVVRTVLAERLLHGQTGLFFLDDPFVKADPERLRALLGMLLEMSRRGWQVLYFSSKGEILELFKQPPLVEQVQLVDMRTLGREIGP